MCNNWQTVIFVASVAWTQAKKAQKGLCVGLYNFTVTEVQLTFLLAIISGTAKIRLRLMQELLQRLKAIKSFEIPDPAEADASLPLGSSMVAAGQGKSELSLVEGAPQALAKIRQRNAKKAGLLEAKYLAKLNSHLNRARMAAKSWHPDLTVKASAALSSFCAEKLHFAGVAFQSLCLKSNTNKSLWALPP